MSSNKNVLYLGIDDSGNLEQNEIMTFGGIIFLNNKEYTEFLKNYLLLINKYKCNYCKDRKNCHKKCPELKCYNLKEKHLKIFLNYLNNFHLMSVAINCKNIYHNILKVKKAKGRYLDYAIKMMVKNAIKGLIKDKLINPYQELELNIYIDESNYKSNGYYNLKESIYEELHHGMNNIKNNSHFKNIIYSNLIINLYFVNSYNYYIIQAADLIAGYTRKNYLKQNTHKLNMINYKLKLPKEK